MEASQPVVAKKAWQPVVANKARQPVVANQGQSSQISFSMKAHSVHLDVIAQNYVLSKNDL